MGEDSFYQEERIEIMSVCPEKNGGGDGGGGLLGS